MSTATLNIEKKKRLVPKLRFPEFEGEWKVDELGNNAKVTSGGTPSRNKKNFWNGNIPWITTSLINFNVINTAEEFITQDAVLKSSAKLFPKGTILMAMYGQGKTRGKVAILGLDATTNQACGAITPNDNLDKDYLFQNLAGRYDEIRDLSNEGGQQNLSGGIIKEIKISFPTLPEQQKIASFLTAVDEKIQQLSRKKELLEQYKKGVMQQLFSGKLRFKDENGKDYADWEEKKLGDVLKIGSGKDYKHLEKGNIPVFGTGGFMLSVNKFLYKGETVFIGRKGTIDKPFYFNGEFWTVDTLFYTHSFKNAIPKFIYCVFQQINWKLHNEASGVPSLSKSTIEKLKFDFPCVQEQQKIANFLSGIDDKIENTKQEINQMQSFKKGLLQQLFV